MNFSAWFSRVTHRKPVDPGDACQSIQPLLSLYSDNMTGPAESARVEAHLLECEDCRRALSWMQATNAVLAHREPAMPPPDMTLRIRSAIAELETGKKARPSRAPLVYRPAFAAAFTILIGAIVVAQITLHHNDRPQATNVPPVVAVQPPQETNPSAAPSTNVKPNAAPVRPIRRNPNMTVAKRITPDTTHENEVGNGELPSDADKSARDNVMALLSGKHLEALREVHGSSDAHSKPSSAQVVKNGDAFHGKQKNRPAPINASPKHFDDTLLANRDVTPSPSTDETPSTISPPSPPTSPAPAVSENGRLASSGSHPIDALSGVRSKVDYMHTVSFMLPDSARSPHIAPRSADMGTTDLSRGSHSGTLAITYDPGPSAAQQHPVRSAEASNQHDGSD